MNIRQFKDNLKDSTEFKININSESIDYKSYLPEKRRKPILNFRYLSLITAVLVLGLFTYLSFNPVTSLTMDINPSIEFKLSVFNRVVSVTGLNASADEMLLDLDLNYKKIDEAVALIYQYSEENDLTINDNVYVLFGIEDENKVDKLTEILNLSTTDRVKSIILAVESTENRSYIEIPTSAIPEYPIGDSGEIDSVTPDYNYYSLDVYPGVTDAKEELIYIIYMNHPESNNSEYLLYLYSLDLGMLYELYNE
ncbi:MAG: hypothetical protein AB7U52_02070 [Candidatus Izemoplasmatales bacterium]